MTLDLAPLLDIWTYRFLLVFARVGGALMLLPGFGDLRVATRLRLLFALAPPALVLPGTAPHLAQQPPAPPVPPPPPRPSPPALTPPARRTLAAQLPQQRAALATLAAHIGWETAIG